MDELQDLVRSSGGGSLGLDPTFVRGWGAWEDVTLQYGT